MAMYKSLFDLSPEQTASTAMPRTVVFSNGTGSGSMTICPLFLGAELYYNDMHLAFFEEATAPMRNVIEINHCRDAPADKLLCFFFLHYLRFLFVIIIAKSVPAPTQAVPDD